MYVCVSVFWEGLLKHLLQGQRQDLSPSHGSRGQLRDTEGTLL